jgi:hypothetical protein
MGLQRDALIKAFHSWPGVTGTKALPVKKTRIDIEALLKWTYLQELPKRPKMNGPNDIDSAWRKVTQWGDEFSMAGPADNAFGVVPDFQASSLPHPDAFVVHEAVEALEFLQLGFPDDWDPIEDLGDLGALGKASVVQAIGALTTVDELGRRILRQSPRRLVFRHAILGGCPDWHAEKPDAKFLLANGMTKWFRRKLVWVGDEKGNEELGQWLEIEVDGFDSRARRPYDDAYPKQYLDPDPVDSVIGRAEYEIWRSALCFVVEELSGQMSDYEAVMTVRPERPWGEPPMRKPFIWPDLSARPIGRLEKIARAAFDIPGARKALERSA